MTSSTIANEREATEADTRTGFSFPVVDGKPGPVTKYGDWDGAQLSPQQILGLVPFLTGLSLQSDSR